MCETCIPILGKMARVHTGKPCILGKALYCSLCCVHGHGPVNCPKKSMKSFRETDGLHIEEKLVYDHPEKDWIEISDSEQAFSAMLIANKIVPMACQEKGKLDERDYHENKQRLIDLVKASGKKLVIISIPWAKAEDSSLRELVQTFTKGTNSVDWKQVASRMTRRTQEHCKARYAILQSQAVVKKTKKESK